MKTVIDIEETLEYFSLQRAKLISLVAFNQEMRAYNDIFVLLFKAQEIPEGVVIGTPAGAHFYHKDGVVYERQFFNDPKMPFGDFTLFEALTKEEHVEDLYEYLTGREHPSGLGFTEGNRFRYSLALIDNKLIYGQ